MDTVNAEWIKLRTLRSTWWTMGIAVFVALVLTALGAGAVISR